MASRVGPFPLHRPSLAVVSAVRRWNTPTPLAAVPVSDARFWLVQALVLAIAGGHNTIEAVGVADELGMLYFVPTSFYFMPVIYAAMYFGLRGSFPTAVLCVAISIPNWLLWHEGLERYGDMSQLAVVVFFGLFVGVRVSHERHLISTLEMVTRALEQSESRYRELFQSAGEAILVLDESERVVECNQAARALAWSAFGGDRAVPIAEMFSPEVARQIAAQASNPDGRPPLLHVTARDGRAAWVEPVCSRVGHTTQVLLRDITQQHQRQADLESYTAHIHRAQEDERRRIAQEIHDETVQSLILLCRELDEAEMSNAGQHGGEQLSRVRAHTEEIIERLRALIRGLRPPLLDDLGLTPAIQRLLDDLSPHSPFQTQLDVSGAVWRAPPSVELAMLRIAQEAISNAARHGAPTRIRVGIDYGPAEIDLVVSDNGRGFQSTADESALVRNGHLGIAGMHERAREAGASLVIRSKPGGGTFVSARYGDEREREDDL